MTLVEGYFENDKDGKIVFPHLKLFDFGEEGIVSTVEGIKEFGNESISLTLI